MNAKIRVVEVQFHVVMIWRGAFMRPHHDPTDASLKRIARLVKGWRGAWLDGLTFVKPEAAL